ncbi:MAG: hypothetical protein QOG57_2639 [Pseudonocardiales bacterium]|nr:hypothetical protein [Pseudonocardiales bacterium]
MLTKADDLPIHQTAEPIAYSGTDRNFYDRYWFGGYLPDASTVFEIAFGVYPHLNIADAHVGIMTGGVQRCLHASRHLNSERLDLTAGPIRIEVLEHLRTLRVVIEESEGFAADLVFTGRAHPIEEPRFTWRNGTRSYLDYTRFTQNGRWTGWLEVDGQRIELPEGTLGTRDRSWGVRPVGARDKQKLVPAASPQFFWVWTPVHFADESAFFHVQAEADGTIVNSRAVLCPDDTDPAQWTETHHAEQRLEFGNPTRWPTTGTVTITPSGQPDVELSFEPLARFPMHSIGYGGNRVWGHGLYHGELVVEREDVVVDDLDPADPTLVHVHTVSRVHRTVGGQPAEPGIGIFETIVLGPYAPYGFTDLSGPIGT